VDSSLPIGLETTVTRDADILYAPVGAEEGVMMSVTKGRYYGVDAVGLRIWELLETPATVAEVCARLQEEFEVDAPTCDAEVLQFVNDLIENGIVHAVGA
jgi:hypothetical protein